MEYKDSILTDILPDQAIFALDIGTRSIIGMVGVSDGDRIRIVAIDRADHTKRAMIDGQIEDIDQVAKIAGQVKDKLEKKLGCRLTKVCVAAAGRALRTESVTYEMELPKAQRIDAEAVSRLEAGAISEAENQFMEKEGNESDRQFYLVGYTVCKYYLDNYIISNLLDHHGRVLKADIIATFLPTEVVESLYASMRKIDLEVASLTLEPIAAINAAIPQNIRLLNLAMVDIGAGTSDIAVCRDGSVTGYTMAILAGDEITETIMREYLVDFDTAEKIKSEIDETEQLRFTDILGFEQIITRDAIFESIKQASSRLCEEISAKIVEANGGMPSAVFLAGGGSRLSGLKEGIVEHLQIDPKRVAVAGNNFKINAFSEDYDLDNPEYATPLGIVISAGLNMINDSFRVILNDRPAKLFRSGTFTVMDILMMNGYNYQDMIGRSGQNLSVHVNGQRQMFYGEKAEPSVLKLNGKESQLSDQVNPGDKIEFVPASHGKNAFAQLSDIVKITGEKRVLLNGQEVEGDLPLKSGDVIVVENLEPELEEEDMVFDWESESAQSLEDYSLQDQEETLMTGSGEKARAEEAVFVKMEADSDSKNDSLVMKETETYETDSNRDEKVLPFAFAGQSMEQDNYQPAYPTEESKKESYIEEPEMENNIPELKGESDPAKLKRKSHMTEPKEERGPANPEEKEHFTAAGQPYEETPPAILEDELEFQEAEPEAVVLRSEAITYKGQLTGQVIKAQEPETQAPQPLKRFRERPLPQKMEHESGEPDTEVSGPKLSRGSSQAETGPLRTQDFDHNRPARRRRITEEPSAAHGQPERPLRQQAEAPESNRVMQAAAREYERKMDAAALSASPQERRTVSEAVPQVSVNPDSQGKITFYLNDKSLLLPLKPDGKRYRLMDLLEYSGLDFKKVTGPVVLEVNGENGYFQQELKAGDHIKIYEKE